MKYISKAVEIFFQDTLNLHPKEIKRCSAKPAYFASIDILENNTNKHFVIALDEKLIHTISSILLFEDEPDLETKYDLTKEVANIIIGRAKVLYEEDYPNNHYQLKTPDLLNTFTPRKYEQQKYKFDTGCCAVFSKENR